MTTDSLASLPAPVGEPRLVKALEWEEYPGAGEIMHEGTGAKRRYVARALHQFGAYCLMEKDGRFSIRSDYTGDTEYTDPDAAKAAAQQDYESRIRSALQPSPVSTLPVAWLAEGPGWKRVFLNREAADKLSDDGRVSPLYAAPPGDEQAVSALQEWQPTHRHVQRGSLYRVVGKTLLQCSANPTLDNQPLVIYESKDGMLWARGETEFNDGRFEALSQSETGHEQTGQERAP